MINKNSINKYITKGNITIGITSKGESFIFDTKYLDAIRKHNWFINNGYVGTNISDDRGKQRRLSLHQLVLGKKDGYIIDHINRDRTDNRKKNLRHVTYKQNSMNRSPKTLSASGNKGIYKVNNKWRACIWISGKRKHLGYFDTKEEAIKSREEAELKHFREFAPIEIRKG